MNKPLATVLLAALATTACTKKNLNPTADGTTVLTWKVADSDREAIRTAKADTVKPADIEYVARMADDTEVKLALHIDFAALTYEESTSKMSVDAPIAVTAKLVGNADFTLADAKCAGPHYQLTAPNVTPPRSTILHCRMSAKKPSYDGGLTFYVYGDGHVDDGVQKTIKVL